MRLQRFSSKYKIFRDFYKGLMSVGVSFLLCSGSLLQAAASLEESNYLERPEVKKFVADMVAKHDFEQDFLDQELAKAVHKESIIKAISRPAEKIYTWENYRPIFLKPNRIKAGIDFWKKNKKTLRKISKHYGVEVSVILAILGVETYYGTIKGSYRVLDSLMTLAFDYPPRSKFFKSELEQFLLLAREENRSLDSFTGSYAGAMGFGQFISSSYRNFAADWDKDGKRDIWDNIGDSSASIANYLIENGWQKKGGLVTRVYGDFDNIEALKPYINNGIRLKGIKNGLTAAEFRQLGVENKLKKNVRVGLIRLEGPDGKMYWLAERKFFVITTYNISRLYAMAVTELASAIKEGMKK